MIMQKRSHTLLARTLMKQTCGFENRRFALAFLFGSFQPDCNPLSYLKGWRHGTPLMGHNFSNSRRYIFRRIRRLQKKSRWGIWQYYTLGKLTHYLADAFTFPHNETYADSLTAHRRYEAQLRHQLAEHIGLRRANFTPRYRDLSTALTELHRQYLSAASHLHRDMEYILAATSLLVSTLLPPAAAGNR
jgi:hypothetical protein